MNQGLALQDSQGFLPRSVARDGQSCHFGIRGPSLDRDHAEAHEDPSEPSTCELRLDSQWIAYGTGNPLSKPAWRYVIGDTPNFGSFWAAKMTPFWDPNFKPPCVPLEARYLCAHGEPGPNSKSCTQREVLAPTSYPVSHWPCPDRVSHPWE